MNEFAQFSDYRKEAIRYWEKRRIIYNLLLIPPSLFSYFMGSSFAAGIGDPPLFGIAGVIILFVGSAISANICYSLVYVIEFLLADSNKESGWTQYGRPFVFICGCILGGFLALLGGKSIALSQYPI